MRAWFHDLPIPRKLFLTTFASSAIALVCGIGGFFTWEILQYRNEIERDLTVEARTISENSSAPLLFGDQQAARETLAVFEIHPYIELACIYGSDQQLFATYYRDAGARCPPAPADRLAVGAESAVLVGPITSQNERIGTLLVQRSLADVRNRIAIGGVILLAFFVFATAAALFTGARMQRTIADPLLKLADTARAVSETPNYSGRAVATSNDELGVVVHAFNDMLDRVQARTDALAEASRLKDEFLATLSHELRTPMNAVLGWVRILRSTEVPPVTRERALETIERNARLQASLIEDLLEVSRIVSGKLHLVARPSDLALIVEAAIEVVQPAASAKNIHLVTVIQSRPAMTIGDPDRLQQVVWNLLLNAVKFTPAGGTVTVRLAQEQGYVLTVSDTGIGIDPSFLPHIFQPFRQADSSPSRQHGGLGLGMTIVRQLVELHGGSVAVRSEGPGKGATFEVWLPSAIPAQEVESGLSTLPGAQPVETVQPGFLAGIDILVVDDDKDTRELLLTVLMGYGARVALAGSAEEAIQALERGAPDVIVSDIGMATEDGYALMRRIRARPEAAGGRVPAVALTAYASPADKAKALAVGFNAHVAKPFEPSALAALVSRLSSTKLHA